MQFFLKLEKDEKSPFILHFIDDNHMFVKSEKVQHLQEKFDEFLVCPFPLALLSIMPPQDGNTFEPTARTR